VRTITGFLVTSLTLFGAFAQASSSYDIDKVKTGILPSGGFYSLYEVDCPDQFTAAIASLNGKRRWCTSYDGQMSCFSSKQDASLKACGSGAVASAEDNLEGVYQPQ
jgi:hypothetical protein